MEFFKYKLTEKDKEYCLFHAKTPPEAARPGDYRNKTKNCVYPDNRHFIVYSDNLYFFY